MLGTSTFFLVLLPSCFFSYEVPTVGLRKHLSSCSSNSWYEF
jgi:hypothetical protein